MSTMQTVGIVMVCILGAGILLALNYAGQVGTVVANEIAPSII
jgi:hypothetical protein